MASCAGGRDYDVVIVGGGTSGTAAAIQAARSGAKVLLVEEHEWLGGMLTSAGVSATDGCYKLRGGIWAEFRDSLEAHYGGPEALKTGWVSNVMFEPSVGARIFANIAAREKNLEIRFNTVATAFEHTDDGWKVSLSQSSDEAGASAVTDEVSGKILVDGTELGDVAAATGIPYSIGMESYRLTGEDIAPEFSNGIIQDLTYVMILQEYDHPVPIPEPDDYDVSEFACCCTNPVCRHPKEEYRMWGPQDMITYGKLPNGKYMINWPLEGNDFYCNAIEMTPEQRDSAFREAKERSIRFLYFMQNELGMKNLGIAEEYPTADGLPFYPYHRESRRIDGQVRFDLNDLMAPYDQPDRLYRTAIAVGDYPVDHHHTRYSGWESLPNLYFHPVPSYGLPIGVMMPRMYDDMLVIEKSISVTNIVNGSTRLQPVVLQLGQAAGVVAAQAVRKNCGVSEVSIREVQAELLDCGAYLLPLLDVGVDSPHFKVIQRIALTGILRYEGRTEGWENQSWFHISESVSKRELWDGFKDFYGGLKREDGTPLSFPSVSSDASASSDPSVSSDASASSVSSGPSVLPADGDSPTDVAYLAGLVSAVDGRPVKEILPEVISVLADNRVCASGESHVSEGYAEDTELSKLECALVIDAMLDPFGSYDVDLHGRLDAEQEKLMWVDLSANWARFSSLDSVKYYCEKIARAGMTAIVLDVKGTASRVPYDSDFTPRMTEWKGVPAPDFDYVGEFSKAARTNGLGIYCSINTFAEGQGYFKKGLIYESHPEWQAVNYVPGEGLKKQIDIERKANLFTNPALPEVRKHACDILAELVTKYDIDGVVLDRARYDNIQSDFSDYSRELFEKYIGKKLDRYPEDIYEWVKNPESGKYEIKRGEYFKQWLEWRASVICSFFEEARAAVKAADPDAAFGAYTGAWYPSYYEVGVNWASKDYDPSEDFDWATENYKNYGYAELLDLYTNGNYYPLVTLEEFRKGNGTYKNETDSGLSSGEHLCVEGACLYSRMLLGPDNPFLGGMYVEDYRNNPEQFMKAVRMNLDKSDGLMVFDLVHIINFGWWQYLETAVRQ